MCDAAWEGGIRCKTQVIKSTKAAMKVLSVTQGMERPGVQGYAVMEIAKSASAMSDPENFVRARLTEADPHGRILSSDDIDHVAAAVGEFSAKQRALATNKPKDPTPEEKAALTAEMDEAKRRLSSQCASVFQGCDVDSMQSDYRALARNLGTDITHEEAPKPTPTTMARPTVDGGRRTVAPGQNSGQRGHGNAGQTGNVIDPARIAEAAGWDENTNGYVTHSMHEHALRTAHSKGFSLFAVVEAAENPGHTYPNGRYPGQMRHIRGNICVVVDTDRKVIVTVYENVTETDLRSDQRDRDALEYGRKRANRR